MIEDSTSLLILLGRRGCTSNVCSRPHFDQVVKRLVLLPKLTNVSVVQWCYWCQLQGQFRVDLLEKQIILRLAHIYRKRRFQIRFFASCEPCYAQSAELDFVAEIPRFNSDPGTGGRSAGGGSSES